MARKQQEEQPIRRRRAPARTPELRENQMIAKAVDLIERRLDDGSASAQETMFYAKLGSSREKLEQQRISMEVEVGKAKIEAMASMERREELFADAIRAMRSYQGEDPQQLEERYDD